METSIPFPGLQVGQGIRPDEVRHVSNVDPYFNHSLLEPSNAESIVHVL
jgi:hypothetical protein